MVRIYRPQTCSIIIENQDLFSPLAYESLMGSEKIPKKNSPVKVRQKIYIYDGKLGFYV